MPGVYNDQDSLYRRQLWPVAGDLAMVHDVAFGLQTRTPMQGGAGIRFEPFVTRWLRESLLGHSHEVVLEAFAYRGKRLRVRIALPAGDQAAAPVPTTTDASGPYPGGASVLGSITLPLTVMREADLLPPPHTNEWEIALEADDRTEARAR